MHRSASNKFKIIGCSITIAVVDHSIFHVWQQYEIYLLIQLISYFYSFIWKT